MTDTETPWTGRTDEVAETLAGEDAVLAQIARQVEPPVCDVGCGPQLLREHVDGDYTGVDFESEWDPDVVAPADDLPFADDRYRTVVTKAVLQHIPDWRPALAECCRVAADRVIVCERTHPHETQVIAEEPVLRRRFNSADLLDALGAHGTPVTASPAAADERFTIYEGVVR